MATDYQLVVKNATVLTFARLGESWWQDLLSFLLKEHE